MVIGITGGICSGKSEAMKIIKSLGISVVNVDDISHEILEQKEVQKKIKEAFLLNDFDRKILSKIVFKNKEKLKILNKIMHPRIIKQMEYIIKENKDELLVMEVPLLFELNLEYLFSKTILIYVDVKMQIERITKRDKKSLEEAKGIINAQMSIDEKIRKADYIIKNDKKIEDLEKEIRKVLGEINENK